MRAGSVTPVRVALRCRPLIAKEVLEGCQTCLQFVPGEPQVILGSNKNFTYDYVFDPETPQDEVYDQAVKGLVTGIFDGYNATVLAYGQTGSGKTFSMGGGYGVSMATSDDVLGVIPRVIKELYAHMESIADSQDVTFKVSYLEIYNEELLDLLVPIESREKDSVTIREDLGGIKLKGLSECVVGSVEEMIGCLESGSHSRTVGSTAMNSSSSRSHAIFTIHVDRANKTDDQDYCKSKFHLVDLAGSERQKKTRAEGERFKEGVNINKGLLALGNVISALGDEVQRNKHVPYRDSKLTRLLQDSLGGNSHTVMIACVSPADSNMEETLTTLRYADRARQIKNKPVVNRDPQAVEILRLRQIVQDLQMQLVETGKPMSEILKGAPVKMESSAALPRVDSDKLQTRIRELEVENATLQDQLNEAVDANVEQAEKVIRLEIMEEEYRAKLEQLREIGQQVSALESSTAAGEELNNMTKTMIHELSQKLLDVEVEHSLYQLDESQDMDDSDAVGVKLTSTLDGTFTLSSGGGGDDSEADPPVSEEAKREHHQRRQKLTQDLNKLNQMLGMKEQLVSKMKASDRNMQQLKDEYENNLKDLEKQCNVLSKEKEELEVKLHSVKASEAKNKIGEQRRLRLKELEQQMTQLKKKMVEQTKMLKMKEQAEKNLIKFSSEIQQMKVTRVKMLKQLREDADNFRKFRQEKEKEVMQLKAKERKRQADMVKLERKVTTQQAVARRKAEEAAVAHKRLKEALMKQKQVIEDRVRRQAASDGSAYSTRLKRWLTEELSVAVAVEEARKHLERLKANRKELAEELATERTRLDDSSQWQPPAKRKQSANSIIDTSQLRQDAEKKVKDLETEMEMISAQIQSLNEKLAESTDNTTAAQGIMAQVSSLSEGRTAVRVLMSKLINSLLRKNVAEKDLEDVKSEAADLEKMAASTEDEMKQEKEQAEEELMKMQRDYETKVLYLMDQLNKKEDNKLESHPTLDEQTRQRFKFQNAEIKRLHSLQDDLEAKTAECEALRRELTTLNYKHRLMKPGVDAAPGEFSFFSPALTAQPVNDEASEPMTRKPSAVPMRWDDSDDENCVKEEEDEEDEEEWVAGQTPGLANRRWPRMVKKTSRTSRASSKSEEDAVKEKTSSKRKSRPR